VLTATSLLEEEMRAGLDQPEPAAETNGAKPQEAVPA